MSERNSHNRVKGKSSQLLDNPMVRQNLRLQREKKALQEWNAELRGQLEAEEDRSADLANALDDALHIIRRIFETNDYTEAKAAIDDLQEFI